MVPPYFLKVLPRTVRSMQPKLPAAHLWSGDRRSPVRCTHQQIEGGDVRDHQQRHVDDRDRVGGAQLSCERGEAELDAMIIVDDDVNRATDIEGDDEEREERPYPH